ncbi:acyl-CoA thioesterase [Burkholderia sp. Ax-1719]|nr:acyl-CoA thioesterase [Burkholderia sp. Ax-1719]
MKGSLGRFDENCSLENNVLFGGSLLRWIDEEAAIYAICQLDNQRVVTKLISEVNFVSSARQGDIIELGITATDFGRTSITLRCEVRNKVTRKSILTIEKMVFVNMGADGKPAPHGRDRIRYAEEAYELYRQTVHTAMDATAVAVANEAAREERQEDEAVH